MSRRPRHPESRHDGLREKAAATSSTIGPVEGWRFSFGWLVTMKRADGSATRHDVETYEAAVELRRNLLLSDPALVVGWVIQKGPPERPSGMPRGEPRLVDDDLFQEADT